MVPLLAPWLIGAMIGEAGYMGERIVLDARFGRLDAGNLKAILPHVDELLRNKNVVAFLRVIRERESHNRDESAYRIMNGGQYFTAPPWVHPGRVFPGGTTTAAGAYQVTKRTWGWVAAEMGLKDFSPANQDRFAVGVLAWLGAINDVVAGNTRAAYTRVSRDAGWTSLPGGSQQKQTAEQADAVFVKYGGRLSGK